MAPEWVHARVHDGVIGITQTQADPRVQVDDQGSWRFSCTMVLRARRIADLERQSELLALARQDARLLLEQDPALASKRGLAIRNLMWLMEQDRAIALMAAG